MNETSRWDCDALFKGHPYEAWTLRELAELLRRIAKEVHCVIELPLQIERVRPLYGPLSTESSADQEKVNVAVALRLTSRARAEQDHPFDRVAPRNLSPKALQIPDQLSWRRTQRRILPDASTRASAVRLDTRPPTSG